MRLDVIETLARQLHDKDQARQVVLAAGFNPADLPAFTNARVFWSNVVDAVDNGKLAGGVTPLLQAAHDVTQSPDIWALLNGADERVHKLAACLASSFTDRDASRQMVARAGFPPHSIPYFGVPLVFWTDVVTQMATGSAPLSGLLDQARIAMPYNQDFAAMQRSHTQSPIRPAPPVAPAPKAPDPLLHHLRAACSALTEEHQRLFGPLLRGCGLGELETMIDALTSLERPGT